MIKKEVIKMVKNTEFGGIIPNLVFVNQKKSTKMEYVYTSLNTMKKD